MTARGSTRVEVKSQGALALALGAMFALGGCNAGEGSPLATGALAQPTAAAQGLLLRLPVEGRSVELRLQPNQTLIAGGYVEGTVAGGVVVSAAAPATNRGACLYRGSANLAGAPAEAGDFAAVSTCAGVDGLLVIGGVGFSLAPGASSDGARVQRLAHPAGETAVEVQVERGAFELAPADGADLTTPSKYLELSIVDDAAVVAKAGSAEAAYNQALAFANLADALYRNGDLTTSVAIVVTAQLVIRGEDPWDDALTNGVTNPNTLISNFGTWAFGSSGAINGDVLFLFSGLPDGSIELGAAFTGSACLHQDDLGVVFTEVGSSALAGSVLAHELGHTLGMQHDGVDNSCDPTGFIMSSRASETDPPTHWSTCSNTYLQAFLALSQSACLNNVPQPIAPRCGDGAVEAGEQCDCGSSDCTNIDPCCNGATCQFVSGAACSDFDGCCSQCQIVTDHRTCLAASDVCDQGSVCDGLASACPTSTPVANGTACNDGITATGGKCFEGACDSLASQCAAVGVPLDATLVACSLPAGSACQTLLCAPATAPTECGEYLNGSGVVDTVQAGASCGTSSQCYQGSCVATSQIPLCPGGVAANACGGCTTLGNAPGAPCGGGLCGVLSCDGFTSLACSGTACDPNATCTNPPRAICTCNQGYIGDGRSCTSLMATSVSLSASVNPSVFGQPVVFSAQVQAGGSAVVSSGTVTFSDGTTALGSEPVDANGNAAFTTAALSAGTHNITASFAPGVTGLLGSSASLPQTIATASTTASLSSSENPSQLGDAVTLTLAIAVAAPGAGAPTGTVQFSIDQAASGAPVSLSAAGGIFTASTTANLAPGAHAISAAYSGDESFAASSAIFSQTVIALGTSTSLASSVNPSLFGQSVTFTATISSSDASAAPTGTVTFAIDQATPIAASLGASGGAFTASYTAAGLSAGSHTIVATYSGDTDFAGSSAQLTQTVAQASTSLSISSSANPSLVGQAVALTITVSGVSAAEEVTYQIDGVPGSEPLALSPDPSGDDSVATLALPALTAGTHTIDASYAGDTNATGSEASFMQVVAPAATPTSMEISSSENPSRYGRAARLKIEVSGARVSGVVQYAIDGGRIESVPLLPHRRDASLARLELPADLAAGAHTIAASYAGSASVAGCSSTFTQIVEAAKTTTELTAMPGAPVFGEPVIVKAKVRAIAEGGTPTGTVQFSVDGALEIAALDASGVATLPLLLAVGRHHIGANYSGDQDRATSGAAPITVAVARASTRTTLSSSANPATPGEAITFTAQVEVRGQGSGTPAGTITFTDGATHLATIAIGASGAATLTISSLAQGAHAITAVYSGDAGFAGSASSTLNEDVKAPHRG